MKIFITVGTTKFDSLIEFLDNNLDISYDVLFQISNGTYLPKNFNYILYSDDINSLYDEYDYIITHAGSGTIYKLLELGKKFITVPNLERVDHHQKDIADFMHKNLYAIRCIDYKDIITTLEKLPKLKFNYYEKDTFFKAKEFSKFITDNL